MAAPIAKNYRHGSVDCQKINQHCRFAQFT
jgi:hypothetical protein